MSTLLEWARTSEQAVISVMGPHAGEDSAVIFTRKINDIANVGRTFWLHRSVKAAPERVRHLIREPSPIFFIAPSSSAGARPTTSTESATEFSADAVIWQPLPKGLSPVTGKIGRYGAYAFVFSDIELCHNKETLDLWEYADGDAAVRFRLGSSTCPVRRKDTSSCPHRMLSRERRIMAVGKLVEPYAVRAH